MKRIKTPHGAARKARRANMQQFRSAQQDRIAQAALSTWSASVARVREIPPPPQHTDVFTITHEHGFAYTARLYAATKDAPANAPAPNRALLHSYGVMTLPQALALRDRKLGL